MKNLLVVLMVLAIATVANAGLVIGGAPVGIVADNVTATLSISGVNGGVVGNSSYWFILSGPGANTGGDFLYSPTDQTAGFAFMTHFVTPDDTGTIGFLNGLGFTTDNAYFISFGTATNLQADGLLVDNIAYTGTGAGQVSLKLVMISGESGSEVIDSFATQTWTQIPEPITMTLLGLGSLFLRRRK